MPEVACASHSPGGVVVGVSRRNPATVVTVVAWAMALAALAGAAAGEPGVGAAERVELLVSAAASLSDVLEEVRAAFETRHPGVRVRLNLGSSGSLHRQIEQGAPVDVFVSAGQAMMEQLVRQGLVDDRSVRAIAGNVVVLVRPAAGGPGSAVRRWDDLRESRVQRIAMGDPGHVPAGQYGQEVLQSLGLWEAVPPKLVLGGDVRQVLAYVEAGEVDAGIVYATDAATAEEGVRVVAAAPAGSHRPAVYLVGVVETSHHPAEARTFAEFLVAPEAQALLGRHAFAPAR